ncbi:MAG: hypothetical protein ACLGH0_13870 [Thermoanaerobaculia bacterium]
MRRITGVLILSLVMLALPLQAGEWVGWITDEHCAAKGAKAEHKGCAESCAKRGAALVFYNSADQKIYKLSDQDAAKKNIGQVKVTGELDGETINVESIAAAPEK